METKCSVLILFVCLAYGASALPRRDFEDDWNWDNSQSDSSDSFWANYGRNFDSLEKELEQIMNEIDHKQNVEQKSEEPQTDYTDEVTTPGMVIFNHHHHIHTTTEPIIEESNTEYVGLEETSTDDQSENDSSTPSTTDGLLSFGIEESTDRNEDFNQYFINEETTKNVATKENAKDLIMAALVQDDADQTKALIEELTGNFSGIDDIVWLGKASERCKLNVAKMLIENGVSVEVHKPDNWHPLQVAAYNGCDEVAKFLIEKGADLNIENGVGSPLSIARNRGNDKIVDLLIKSLAETSFVDPWYIVQHTTTEHTDAESTTTENNVNQKVVENDEQKGKDMILNAILKDDEQDTENQIENLIAGYLKVAAEKCKPKVAKMFIQNGLNVNESYGEMKWRLLHFATYSECEEIVKILIDNGADIDVKTGTGYTALHMAAKNGNAKIIELLIKNGADIEIKDFDFLSGWTALEWAQSKNHAAAVKVLIDNGAKQPKRDFDSIIEVTTYEPSFYDY